MIMKKKFVIGIICVGIWLVFRFFPTVTEVIYSEGIFPFFAKIRNFLFGWLPFSMGDVLYTLLFVYIFYFLLKNRKNIRKKPILFLKKSCFFVFYLVFSFFFLWGFNYFRIPLEKTLQIDPKYTIEELFSTTEKYIEEANFLHQQLAKNDTTKVEFSLSKKQIYEIPANSYYFKIDKITDYQLVMSVKSSLYSTALSYMGYSGYINPFTNEAQINGKMVGYSTLITVCHEIAHQRGYAAEHEANFLGYLSAKNTDNQYFMYSASLFALRYLLAEVRKVDAQKYEGFLQKIRKGILLNYKETRDFWKQYENKSEPIFKATYDAFLKANNQSHGIKSYNNVVGLLIGFHRNYTVKEYVFL